VAPLLYKRIDRVESMLCVFFLALLIQSLIERQVRRAMKNQKIEALPVYPEQRLSFFPTTVKVLDQFDGVSKYHLRRNGQKVQEFSDQLNSTQKAILRALIPEIHILKCAESKLELQIRISMICYFPL